MDTQEAVDRKHRNGNNGEAVAGTYSARHTRAILLELILTQKSYTVKELQGKLWEQTHSLNLGSGESVREYLDRQVRNGALVYDAVTQRYSTM